MKDIETPQIALEGSRIAGTANEAEIFHARLKGTFSGILQWHHLDELWSRIKGGRWFFYQVGDVPPVKPLDGEELAVRIDALNMLLRRGHDYHYCGIVYADNVDAPALVKVYDPSNLGCSCSRSDSPAPPGWILSTFQPAPIEVNTPAPKKRKRWWRIFHNG